jgi:fibrillarin-like pre-rRNA processing protein
MDPSDVFKQEVDVLRKGGMQVVQSVRLEPYEKDHAMILAKKE